MTYTYFLIEVKMNMKARKKKQKTQKQRKERNDDMFSLQSFFFVSLSLLVSV